MISISEIVAVPAAPKRVWEVVSDPAQVVSCIAGAELGAAHEDGTFDGTLAVKFGAIRVKFAARIGLELAESELEGRLTARGRDGQGATRFSAHATFRVTEGEGPGDARVAVDGEIQLSGRLVSVIEAGAGVVVSKMTREFSAALVQRCAPAAEPAASAAPAAASTTATATATVTTTARPTGLLNRLRLWWARLLRKETGRDGAQA